MKRREKKKRANKSHLRVLFDRYEHSFLKLDVLCCEKVQVRFCLLFSLAFLESINFWKGRGSVSGAVLMQSDRMQRGKVVVHLGYEADLMCTRSSTPPSQRRRRDYQVISNLSVWG